MAGRPPKHLSVVDGHLSNEDKKARAEGEKNLTAKSKMKKSADVRKNKAASGHFNRLTKLYGEIGLCDALCENTINRYCLLLARLSEVGDLSTMAEESITELRERRDEMEATDYFATLTKMTQNITALERAAAKVRDQLLAIERENLLTIQGKLRAVPKKAEKPKAKGGIASYREKYGGGAK